MCTRMSKISYVIHAYQFSLVPSYMYVSFNKQVCAGLGFFFFFRLIGTCGARISDLVLRDD